MQGHDPLASLFTQFAAFTMFDVRVRQRFAVFFHIFLNLVLFFSHVSMLAEVCVNIKEDLSSLSFSLPLYLTLE